MKLLANSFYGYQIMDPSRHTVTKYLSDKTTHVDINSKLNKKLNHMNNAIYEVELVKAQIEHNEPTIVRLFLLHFLKLRSLEFFFNFPTKFCDVNVLE